ncbi:hypothetical protein EV129_11392 [Rhizobium azibense]|uniref:Uncharacterized protein n=1 Tax=Rhizobium azibense TaxID=1136135 RepID=A0A4R3RI97_9HYPH|nr:hypothetical protein EV129_11392 [Rhizobium azibense]
MHFRHLHSDLLFFRFKESALPDAFRAISARAISTGSELTRTAFLASHSAKGRQGSHHRGGLLKTLYRNSHPQRPHNFEAMSPRFTIDTPERASRNLSARRRFRNLRAHSSQRFLCITVLGGFNGVAALQSKQRPLDARSFFSKSCNKLSWLSAIIHASTTGSMFGQARDRRWRAFSGRFIYSSHRTKRAHLQTRSKFSFVANAGKRLPTRSRSKRPFFLRNHPIPLDPIRARPTVAEGRDGGTAWPSTPANG